MAFDYTNYYELTYIESSGSQYIVTSIAPNTIGRIKTEARFKSTSRQMLLASWNHSYNAYMVQIGYNKDLGYWVHEVSPTKYTDGTIINTTDYYAYDFDLNAGTLKINGSTVQSTSGYALSTRPLYIFASNDSDEGAYLKTSAYLKYLEIYNKSGVLAYNFIPARRKTDNVVGLYETVSETFYTNSGSGSFTGGPLVTPKFDNDYYYPLEYLETDGTAFINTGYKYNSHNLKFDIDLSIPSLPSGYRTILGMYTSSSKGTPFTIWTQGGNNYLFNDVLSIHYPYNFDGTRQNFVFESQSVSGSSYDLYLFKAYAVGGNVFGGISGTKIYTCSFYDNGDFVCDFVPARRKSDGVLGMYDTRLGVFLTNAGSGSFTGGKRVSQDFDYDTYYELEYVETNKAQRLDTGVPVLSSAYSSFEFTYDFQPKTIDYDYNSLYCVNQNDTTFEAWIPNTGIIRVRAGSVVFAEYSANTSRREIKVSRSSGTVSLYDSVTQNTYTRSYSSTNNYNLLLCGKKDTSMGNAYVYGATVKTNGNLVRKFVPAERKSDGVAGFFDTVYGVFYTSDTTTNFIAGGRIQYVITGNVTPTGSGYVSGTGSFYKGETTTLVATANTGYAFQQWSDGVLTDTRTITVTENATYTAVFYVPISITLVYDSNYGTASYVWSGQNIILTATPNSSGQLVGWYIGSTLLSTNNPYTYTPQGDTTIECRFEEVYSVTASVSGNGSISYTRGEDQNDVTFTVIPNEHYHFVKYSVNGTDTATNPLTIHLTQATTVIAYFEEDTVHHITATTNIGYNSVFISANDVYYGTPVILWARPYPNYNFVRWDDGNTENPRTITVTANVTMVAIFQREFDTNGIYQYRCYVKDQMDLTEKPKAFMRVDTFNIKNDLMTTANSTITVLDSFSNVNNGDVLVLYDPMGTTLYQGVIKSIEDNKIVCSQMQSFYSGTWIYNIYPSATLEEELAYLLGQYAQGKMYNSTYTDPLVAQRLGGITIDYTASTSVNLPSDLDSDGNENLTEYDMEKFIYEMYEKYGIIFDFEISFAGTNYVHIKVPTYSSMKVGNNMYAIKDMKPVTAIEETNRLIIFAQDKSYRTTYVATANSIEEEPSTTANRFDLTNTKIVYSDDAVADLIAANLPDQMYNHKLDFTLVIKNFIYQFGDFNLGGSLDIYYYDEYYNSVLSGYEISKASNQNITEVKMVCGKVRSKLTQKLTLGRLQ